MEIREKIARAICDLCEGDPDKPIGNDLWLWQAYLPHAHAVLQVLAECELPPTGASHWGNAVRQDVFRQIIQSIRQGAG